MKSISITIKKGLFTLLLSLKTMSLNAAYLYVPQASSANAVQVIDTATNTTIATVTNISAASAATTTPNGQYVYIASGTAHSVFVINTLTNTKVATIAVPSSSFGIAASANGNFIYLPNAGTAYLSVISTSFNGIIATITIGTSATSVAAHPTANKAIVTNGASNNVSVVDMDLRRVIATVPVGTFPYAVAFHPNGNYAYIANNSSQNISVMNTGSSTITATIALGVSPKAIAITPNGSYGYVTNTSPSVSIINTSTNSVIGTITLPSGSTPRAISIDASGSYAYITNTTAGGDISVISTATNSIVATIASSYAGNGATLALAAPHQALVIDSLNNNLFMIDETAINQLPISVPMQTGLTPANIALTQDRMYAYITQNGSSQISYISMQYGNLFPTKKISSISVGTNPNAMTLSVSGNYLYVTDSGDNTVYRINRSDNSATLIATLTSACSSIGIDPTDSYLVVALPTANQIAIISSPSTGSPSTSYVNVGTNPNSIAFDQSGKSYVTCSDSNQLYQIVLSSGATSSLSLTGISPGAISSIQVGGTLYFLIAMQASNQISLVNPTTMTEVSTPSTSAIVQQMITNPSIQSVAYLIEPGANAIQSIDFTSSLISPTLSSQYTTGTHPIGGGCRENGSQLFILNKDSSSVSVYTLQGTNNRDLVENAASPVTGLGTPSGISVAP